MNYIRSIKFGIFITFCAILSQSYHSYFVFLEVGHIEGWPGVVQALLFVMTWESFTLFWTARGRKGISLFYSICQILMNNFYYWQKIGWDKSFLVSVFISFILPVSIYQLADEINKESQELLPEPIASISEEIMKFISQVQSRLMVTPEYGDIKGLQIQIDEIKKAGTEDNIQIVE